MKTHLKKFCLEIEYRYDYIKFLEIGADNNHIHFLIQSTPNYAPANLIKIIKSITARQKFLERPEIKNIFGEDNFIAMDASWHPQARIQMKM